MENLEELIGQDNLIGRPLQVNVVRLNVNAKNRAEIIPIGDIHAGCETFDQNKFEETINFCLDNNVYVIGMGDYIDLSTKASPGHSVFNQWPPMEQIAYLLKWFGKLTEKKLLLGVHNGNHEMRLSNLSGIDITKFIAKSLGVRYFGWAIFHLLYVGKQSYIVYSTHGASGARLPYTKIKSVLDLYRFVVAEAVMMGHVHEKDVMTSVYYEIDKKSKQLVERKRLAILTGHFLKYRGSYAEEKNMIPSKTGVIKLKFQADEHKISVTN